MTGGLCPQLPQHLTAAACCSLRAVEVFARVRARRKVCVCVRAPRRSTELVGGGCTGAERVAMARLAPSAHIAASAVCVFLLLMLGVQTTVATVTNTSSITTANGRGTGLKLSQVDGKVSCYNYHLGTNHVSHTHSCLVKQIKRESQINILN